jgi:hypothetical protein
MVWKTFENASLNLSLWVSLGYNMANVITSQIEKVRQVGTERWAAVYHRMPDTNPINFATSSCY